MGTQRDRAVDAARVFAMLAVVVGHWLVTAVDLTDGDWMQSSPLVFLGGGWVATHLLQVVPLFFIVGGFAGAAAWTSRGGSRWDFVRTRLVRLAAPAGVLLAVLGVVGALLLLAGLAERDQVAPAIGLATQPLWFIAVYVGLSAATPWTHELHRRLGWRAPAGALALSVLVDVGATAGVVPWPLHWVNLPLVWAAAYQLGYVLRGRVPAPSTGLLLTAGAWALDAVLWATLDYPLELVGVTGSERSNMAPPSALIVAQTVVSFGLFAAVKPRLDRLLRRPAAWALVQRAGEPAMAVFLLHLVALLLVTGAAGLAGDVPGLSDRPDSWGWVAARVAWFPVLAAVLAVLVGGFRRVAPV